MHRRPATGQRLPPASVMRENTTTVGSHQTASLGQVGISPPKTSQHHPRATDAVAHHLPKNIDDGMLDAAEVQMAHQQPVVASRWSAHRPLQQQLYHFQDTVMPIVETDRAISPIVQWNKRTDDPALSSSSGEDNRRRQVTARHEKNTAQEHRSWGNSSPRQALRGNDLHQFLSNNFRFALSQWEKIANESSLPSREENFKSTLAEAAQKIRQAIADTYRSSSSSSSPSSSGSGDDRAESSSPAADRVNNLLDVKGGAGSKLLAPPKSPLDFDEIAVSSSILEQTVIGVIPTMEPKKQLRKKKKRRPTVPVVDTMLGMIAGHESSTNVKDRESNLQDILDLVDSVSREHALNAEEEFSPPSPPSASIRKSDDDDSMDLFGGKNSFLSANAANAFTKRSSTIPRRSSSYNCGAPSEGSVGGRKVIQRVTSPVSLMTEDDLDRKAAEERMKEIEVSSLQHLKDVYDSMAHAKKHKLQYKSHAPPTLSASSSKKPVLNEEAAPDVPSPSSIERALLLERQMMEEGKPPSSSHVTTTAPKEKKRLNFGNKSEKSSDSEKMDKGHGIPGKPVESSVLDEGLCLAVHGIRRAGAASAVPSDADSAADLESSATPSHLQAFDYLTVWLINTTEHDAFTVHAANDESLGFDMLPVKSKSDGSGVLTLVLPGTKVEAARLIPSIPAKPNATYALKCAITKKEEYIPPPPPPVVADAADASHPAGSSERKSNRKLVQKDAAVTGPTAVTASKADLERAQHEMDARAAQLSKAMKLYKDLQVLQESKSKTEDEPKRDASALRRPTLVSVSEPSVKSSEKTAKPTPLLPGKKAEGIRIQRTSMDNSNNNSNETVGATPPPPTHAPAEGKKKKRNSKSLAERTPLQGGTDVHTSAFDVDTAYTLSADDQQHDLSGDTNQHNPAGSPSSGNQEVVVASGDDGNMPPSVVSASAGEQHVTDDHHDDALPRIHSTVASSTLRQAFQEPHKKIRSSGKLGTSSSRRQADHQSSLKAQRGRRASYATMEKRKSEIFREEKLFEDLYVREDPSMVKKDVSRPRYVRPKSNSVFDVSTFVRSRHAAEPPVEDDVAKMIRSLRSRPQAPSSANRGLTFSTPIAGKSGKETSQEEQKSPSAVEGKEPLSASLGGSKQVTADVLLESLSGRTRSVSFAGDDDASGDEDDERRHASTDSEQLGGKSKDSGGTSTDDSDGGAARSSKRKHNVTNLNGSSMNMSTTSNNSTATRGKVRRELRPNQIRTLAPPEGNGAGVKSPRQSALLPPGGSSAHPRVSFVEADENNAVLDAVLAPLGRSLLDDPPSSNAATSSGVLPSDAASPSTPKDFVDRLVDEAAASSGNPDILLSRIKSAASGSAGRKRAHTTSSVPTTSPKPGSTATSGAPDAHLFPRRATVSSIASRMSNVAVGSSDVNDLTAIGVKVDDSYRLSRRTSRQSMTPQTENGEDEDPKHDDDNDQQHVEDGVNGTVDVSIPVTSEERQDRGAERDDDARELFNEQPERFVTVGNDIANSIGAKIAEQIDDDDGKDHPSNDLQKYHSVPRHHTPLHPDDVQRRLAADAEASRLYAEQERLAQIMKRLVEQVKQIWRYESEESVEQKSTQAFFKLSMDVAWRLQQRRNINLGKLLNLLERKCGERRGNVRDSRNWMPYYRDDNVFVDNDDDVSDDGDEVAVAPGGDRGHAVGKIIAQGFHPTTRSALVVEDNIFRQRNGVALDCEQELVQHVQRLLPPGRLEELIPTCEPEMLPAGFFLRPSKPLVPRTPNYAKICVLQLGDSVASSSQTSEQEQLLQQRRAHLSSRALARERLRALRKRRVMRFVLMDGTEIETFTRFPSWQSRYS